MATFEDKKNEVPYMKIGSQGSQGQHSPNTYGFSVPQRDLAEQLDLIEQEMQSGSPKEDSPVPGRHTETSAASITPNEMQMVYDSQIGQFISIHEHESNVVVHDSVTYTDHNFNQALQFTTISSARVDPDASQ